MLYVLFPDYRGLHSVSRFMGGRSKNKTVRFSTAINFLRVAGVTTSCVRSMPIPCGEVRVFILDDCKIEPRCFRSEYYLKKSININKVIFINYIYK